MLDFLNTVGGHRLLTPREDLETPEDLVSWGLQSGWLDAGPCPPDAGGDPAAARRGARGPRPGARLPGVALPSVPRRLRGRAASPGGAGGRWSARSAGRGPSGDWSAEPDGALRWASPGVVAARCGHPGARAGSGRAPHRARARPAGSARPRRWTGAAGSSSIPAATERRRWCEMSDVRQQVQGARTQPARAVRAGRRPRRVAGLSALYRLPERHLPQAWAGVLPSLRVRLGVHGDFPRERSIPMAVPAKKLTSAEEAVRPPFPPT